MDNFKDEIPPDSISQQRRQAEEETNNEYIDITPTFLSAVDSLSYTNPILCDESTFDLYDTMAALELMDTKMDSCEIDASFYARPPSPTVASSPLNNNDDDAKQPPTTTIPPRPPPQSLNDTLVPLPWSHLTLSQSLTIILETTTRFESMVGGSNIAESVYTCLYAHDPILMDMKERLVLASASSEEEDDDDASDALVAAQWAVYAGTLAMVKTTQIVRRIVHLADIYEEEDFSMNSFGFKFFRRAADLMRNGAGGGWNLDGKRVASSPRGTEGVVGPVQSCGDGVVIGDEFMYDVTKVCDYAKDVVNKLVTGDDDVDGEDKRDGGRGRGDDDDDEIANQVHVIVRVLDFYMDLHHCCAALSKLTKDNVLEKAASVQQTVRNGVKNIDTLITTLQMMKNQNEKQQQPQQQSNIESSPTEPTTTTTTTTTQQQQQQPNHTKLLLSQTFDPNVNRRLLGNTPVRQVHFLTPLRSISTLRTILHSIDWAVCNLLLRGNSLERIRRMLSSLSSPTHSNHNNNDDDSNDRNSGTFGGGGGVNILTRSLIVLNLYFDDLVLGQHVLPVIIMKHMHRCGVPHSITSTVYGSKFIERLGKPVYDTLKVLALNVNRQRANYDTIMFEEWAGLQRDAAMVDRAFCEDFQIGGMGGGGSGGSGSGGGGGATTAPMPFVTNYVLGITVQSMARYLTLGIELDLVTNNHHHLATTYWYLDFLLSTQLSVMKGMRDTMRERKLMQAKIEALEEEEARAASGGSSGGGKGKKKGGKKSNRKGKKKKGLATTTTTTPGMVLENEITPEDREDNLEMLMLEMKRTKCRGILRFISALNQAKIITTPTYTFTTPEICFRRRFSSFHKIHQPQPLTYDDFCAGSDVTLVKSADLLASTADCFKSCRTILDVILKHHLSAIDSDYAVTGKEEVMNLLKACVGNSLFLHKLSQVVAEEGEGKKGNKGTTATVGRVEFNFTVHRQFCSIVLS